MREVYVTAIKDYLLKSQDYQQLKFIREPKEVVMENFRRISMETEHYLPEDKINVELWSLFLGRRARGVYDDRPGASSKVGSIYGPLIENSFETFAEKVKVVKKLILASASGGQKNGLDTSRI